MYLLDWVAERESYTYSIFPSFEQPNHCQKKNFVVRVIGGSIHNFSPNLISFLHRSLFYIQFFFLLKRSKRSIVIVEFELSPETSVLRSAVYDKLRVYSCPYLLICGISITQCYIVQMDIFIFHCKHLMTLAASGQCYSR